uniref:thiamine phosphate synthase n=1 Tax=Enterobacter hormaechei TaxID=158836 RepID=UPI00203FB16A
PDVAPLGWDAFAELRAQVSLPIYALGGMGSGHITEARRHGGQGIAAIRGLWRACCQGGIRFRWKGIRPPPNTP